MTLVVDASALVWAVTSAGSEAAAFRDRLAGQDVHAPHLIDAEAGSALRSLVLTRVLPAGEALGRLRDGAGLVDHRYRHTDLFLPAWELRDNVSFYDALYAALARALEAPLCTVDRRLADAPGLPCLVEVVGL